MLTAALRRVLDQAPAELEWDQLEWDGSSGSFKGQTASFEAVGSDGHLYSLNCLTGTVLEDGAPPGRLPSEILQHPLYLRTFAVDGTPWGFEITLTASGVRRTTAAVRGRHYEFFRSGGGGGGSSGSSGGTLVVTEIDARGNRLELLDCGVEAACAGWGPDLPPRLRELHSHWLCRRVWQAAGCAERAHRSDWGVRPLPEPR